MRGFVKSKIIRDINSKDSIIISVDWDSDLHKWGFEERREYLYDNDLILQEIFLSRANSNEQWNPLTRWRYEYENGLKVFGYTAHWNSFDQVWDNREKSLYYYTDSLLISDSTFRNRSVPVNWEPKYSNQFSYNANGKIIYKKRFTIDYETYAWWLEYADTIYYNAHQYDTLKIHYSRDHFDSIFYPSSKHSYKYDDKGHRIFSQSAYWNHNQRKLVNSSKTIKKYDAYGNSILNEYYDWNEESSNWLGSNKYGYVYDQYKNELGRGFYFWNSTDNLWEGDYSYIDSLDYSSPNSELNYPFWYEYTHKITTRTYNKWQSGKWVDYNVYDYHYSLHLDDLNTSSTIDTSTCQTYTSPSGKTLNNSGVYSDTIPNRAGYDSIIVIQLTIHPMDKSVSMETNELRALLDGATYQWLDCSNDFAPIEGETNQSFAPETDGNYAVIIKNGVCVDTSECLVYTKTGLVASPQSIKTIEAYPNPVKNYVAFDLGTETTAHLEILNISGKVVLLGSVKSDNPISLQHLDYGVYIYKIAIEDKVVTGKFIKKE